MNVAVLSIAPSGLPPPCTQNCSRNVTVLMNFVRYDFIIVIEISVIVGTQTAVQ